MKPHILLRAAAVVTALLCVGHTTGAPWTPIETTLGHGIVAAMKNYRTEVLGATRGYWDFYQGFGISVSVFLAAFAVLTWQLAGTAKASPASARPMIATLLLAFVGIGAIDLVYFFWPPITLT